VTPARVESFQSVTGQGVTGLAKGRRVALGNVRLLGVEAADAPSLAARAEELRRDGQTVMYLAVDGALAGSWAWPIRSRRPPPRLFACFTLKASA
jgi:Cu+-exporting ATPase